MLGIYPSPVYEKENHIDIIKRIARFYFDVEFCKNL